jgi:hypothetical protein
MGWTVRGSNPDGSEIFRTSPDRPSSSGGVTEQRLEYCVRVMSPELKWNWYTVMHGQQNIKQLYLCVDYTT